MAHMIPEYSNEPFMHITDASGDSWLVPAEIVNCLLPAEVAENNSVMHTYDDKWFFRLTAPGYLDQTMWDGPFDSLDAAKAHVAKHYEVDPDTGEDLMI